MTLHISIDNVDITDQLNKQYPLPNTTTGIAPGVGRGQWYDLLQVISDTPALQAYFEGGMHRFTIVDDSGRTYKAKLVLRAKYTSRNH